MITEIFLIPEILLGSGFVLYFFYNIYTKVTLQVSIFEISTKILMFLVEIIKKGLKANFDKLEALLIEIRLDLGLPATTQLRKFEGADRKAIFCLAILCFLVFFICGCEIFWFTCESSFLGERVLNFNGSHASDIFTFSLKALVILLCGIYFLITYVVSKSWKFYGYEFGFFIFIIMYSMLFVVSSFDFFMLYLSLELQTLAIIILCAYQMSEKPSIEGALKYFFQSCSFSGLFLFCISLIYLLVGTISFEGIYQITMGGTLGSRVKDEIFIFNMIIICFFILFKLGIFPYHFWTPDLYQGSSLMVVTFIAVVSKVGVVSAAMRLFYHTFLNFFYVTTDLMYSMGLVSMFIGAAMALVQTDIRRFLAFTSVSNLGFVLMGFSFGTFEGIMYGFFYFISYIFGTLAFFIFLLGSVRVDLSGLPEEKSKRNQEAPDLMHIASIYDLKGFFKTNRMLSIGFILAILNLLAVPPFHFFFAKYFLFEVALTFSFNQAVIILVLSSFASAFYYLRLIRILFLERDVKDKGYVFSSFTMSIIFYLLVLVNIILFFYPLGLEYIFIYIDLVLRNFY